MSLLFGESFDDPRSSAIMGLAQGLLAGNLGQGLGLANQNFQEAKQGLLRKQLMDMQMGEIAAQTRERQLKAQREEAEMQRQARIQAGLPRLYRQPGLTGGEAAPQTIGGIPMFSQPMGVTPMRSTPGGFDVMGAIDLGLDPESIQKYAALANLGRQKVARVEETMKDGRPVKRQLDEFGQPVGSDLDQWKQPHFQNLGNRTTAVDPVTLKELTSFAMGQSPDSAASVAATIRGQNMTDARAREANSISREAQQTQIINDPVLGPLLVNKGTGVTRPAVGVDGKPIPGEKTIATQKGASDVLELLKQAETILPNATGSYAGAGVDKAAQFFGYGTEGAEATAQLRAIEGALIAKMPRMEGPQSNLDQQLYRQASGQLGDPTLPASLKQAAIQTIKTIQQKYAGQPTTPTRPNAPQPGAVQDGYRFKGGNPADPKSWEKL